MNSIVLNNVSFCYDNSPDNILNSIYLQFSPGWTGIIGPNGSGKTTLLKIAANQLIPTSGNVKSSGIIYYCEQRADFLPSGYKQLLKSYDKISYRLLNILKIYPEWFNRWDTLSHGERKRCQIAVALFHNPDILLVDEPTNHIDSKNRDILLQSLKLFKGIGLIVSHDRNLLNEICKSIVSLNDKGHNIIDGNYDTYENELNKRNKHIMTIKRNLNKEIKKIRKEVKSQQEKISRSDKRVSKRNISSRDHDSKSKIDAARLTGKDEVDGKKYVRLKSKLDQLTSNKEAIGSIASRELGVKLEENKYSKSVIVFKPRDEIKLGNHKTLLHPDLYLNRNDKIGLVGENGSGKSTIIEHLVKIINDKLSTYTYIPQEISTEQSKDLLLESVNLNHEDKGRIFTIISRLNSDPKHLFHSHIPSPGEVRKLMLAHAIMKKQSLIIMDEPTNHMDLQSIECIENALNKFNGALLLVSHDKVFLENTVKSYWQIELNNENKFQLSS